MVYSVLSAFIYVCADCIFSIAHMAESSTALSCSTDFSVKHDPAFEHRPHMSSALLQLKTVLVLVAFEVLLATCFDPGFFLSLFSALNMDVICSSETSVDSQRTTRRYIPDGTLLVSILLEQVKLSL
jgi:hypothetical protein